MTGLNAANNTTDTPDEPVAERERVEMCFATARNYAKRITADEGFITNGIQGQDQQAFAVVLGGIARHATTSIVNALEGVARQIRDMDDQQYQSADAMRTLIAEQADALREELAEHARRGRENMQSLATDLDSAINAISLTLPEKHKGW